VDSGGRPEYRAFFLATRFEEAPQAPRRQRWCSSVPQNHHPGQLAAQTAFYFTFFIFILFSWITGVFYCFLCPLCVLLRLESTLLTQITFSQQVVLAPSPFAQAVLSTIND
jgi:hypothetical protein